MYNGEKQQETIHYLSGVHIQITNTCLEHLGIILIQLSVFGGWYQPIGAGGTRSPRRTASKIQNGHWGPENDRRGLQRCPSNGC